MYLFLLKLLCLIALSASKTLSEPQEQHRHLYWENDANIFNMSKSVWRDIMDSDEIYVVQYYASYCDICDSFVKDFKQVASDMEEFGIRFAVIHCDFNKKLCDDAVLDGLPTVRLFKGDPETNPYVDKLFRRPIDYTGAREYLPFYQFIDENMDSAVIRMEVIDDIDMQFNVVKSLDERERQSLKKERKTQLGRVENQLAKIIRSADKKGINVALLFTDISRTEKHLKLYSVPHRKRMKFVEIHASVTPIVQLFRPREIPTFGLLDLRNSSGGSFFNGTSKLKGGYDSWPIKFGNLANEKDADMLRQVTFIRYPGTMSNMTRLTSFLNDFLKPIEEPYDQRAGDKSQTSSSEKGIHLDMGRQQYDHMKQDEVATKTDQVIEESIAVKKKINEDSVVLREMNYANASDFSQLQSMVASSVGFWLVGFLHHESDLLLWNEMCSKCSGVVRAVRFICENDSPVELCAHGSVIAGYLHDVGLSPKKSLALASHPTKTFPVESAMNAVEFAWNNLPDITTPVAHEALQYWTSQNVRTVLTAQYKLRMMGEKTVRGDPVMLAVIALSDNTHPSALFKNVALLFNNMSIPTDSVSDMSYDFLRERETNLWLAFGFAGNPPMEMQSTLQVSSIPSIVVMYPDFASRQHVGLTIDEQASKMKLNLRHYDQFTYGLYSVANIRRFLINVIGEINSEARDVTVSLTRPHILMDDISPITKPSSDSLKLKDIPVPEVTADSWSNELCNPKEPKLCVMFFFSHEDSRHLKDMNLIRNVIRSALSDENMIQSSLYSFMWVNGLCYTDFEQQFAIDPSNLPAMVVFSPKKLRFVIYSGEMKAAAITDFLSMLATGEVGSAAGKVSSIPFLDDVDCDVLLAKNRIFQKAYEEALLRKGAEDL